MEAWWCDRAWALCAMPNAMSAMVKTVWAIVSRWAQAFCALLAAMDKISLRTFAPFAGDRLSSTEICTNKALPSTLGGMAL